MPKNRVENEIIKFHNEKSIFRTYFFVDKKVYDIVLWVVIYKRGRYEVDI